MAKKKPLTDRQQEILAALEGRSVAEAAKKLGIKPAAVYGHIGRIREAGHKVVLNQRGKNGDGTLPPADLPPLRDASAAATSNGALDGVLGRIDKETDGALEQTRSALDEAKAEREKLVAKLADVDGVIEQHTATLGVLADVSARLHNAPISA
jgi:DNA-binding Lrp family transcriptional regulator